MKAPDKLYLQPEVVFDQYNIIGHNDLDTEYIRKDALIEWIQEVRAIPHENAVARDLAFQEIVNKLNSM